MNADLTEIILSASIRVHLRLIFMKEIQKILKKISNFASDEKAILATVIDVVGSGYRRPGARMLIDENGYSIGTVSGGCLEADVLERAKKVLETGEPTVITYDTTADENSVFGLNMGCRGIVRILLEPVDREGDFFDFLSLCLNQRTAGNVATLINPSGNDLKVGWRMFENEYKDLPNNSPIEKTLEIENLPENAPAIIVNSVVGEVFFEKINPPLNLLLFGAGYDAIPLIDFAKEIGWRVTAIDHRAAFANKERLPKADEIIVSASEDLPDDLFADENSAAVIMTHNYERDRDILRRLLRSKCAYIGALGPKPRTERLLKEIGENFSADELAKLYAPVGLDIGADTPETIALAIAAEIQAVLAGREAGFLRNRRGSIYGQQKL